MQYTKATLKAALQSWPDDDEAEFVANLDAIIQLAETKVLRDLDLGALDKEASAALAGGSRSLTKPADMIAELHLWYTAGGVTYPIRKRTREFCLEYGRAGESGLPKYYCEQAEGTWHVVPTPNAAITVNVRYQYRPPSITSGNDGFTTFLSTKHGDLLFNACLIEAFRFLKSTARVQEADAFYNDRLPQARAEVARLRRTDQLDLTIDGRTLDAPSGAADQKG